jgi:hypothetical protein
MFSQKPNGKWADGPSDSLCVGLKGEGLECSEWGPRRPRVGVGGDRDGFLGEKPLEIGRAAKGRFLEMGGGRKKEIGSR